MSEILQIKVIDKSVYPVPPRRAHPDDAGVDLRSTETYAIRPGSAAMVDLGVKVAVPRGYVGQLLVRSSIGFGRLLLCTGGAGDGREAERRVLRLRAEQGRKAEARRVRAILRGGRT